MITYLTTPVDEDKRKSSQTLARMQVQFSQQNICGTTFDVIQQYQELHLRALSTIILVYQFSSQINFLLHTWIMNIE